MNNNESRRTTSPIPAHSNNADGTPTLDGSADILTRKVPSQQGIQMQSNPGPNSLGQIQVQPNSGQTIPPNYNMPQSNQMIQNGRPVMMPNGQPMMMMQNGQPVVMQPGQPVMMQPVQPMYRPVMVGPNGPPGYFPGQPVNPSMGHPNMIGSSMPNRPPVDGNSQFNAPSRFENDNKGLQNLQVFTTPSTFESTQIASAKCGAWCGTWFCGTNPYKIVPEGYSGIIMRFDKFYKLVGPGQHYTLHEIDRLELIDKRERVLDLKQQSVVSKDNTTFKIDAVLYYKVTNTYKSRFAVRDLPHSLMDLGVTTLRNAVGRMTMQQFLELREHFSEQIQEEITPIVSQWGTKVSRVLVQDVYLPPEFRTSFSTSAVMKKISEAQVISSKADVEVAKLMRDAAEALSTDAAFQIRYIDAVEAITNSSNPKMIFFPAHFADVGTANNDLLESVSEEVESLLRKR